MKYLATICLLLCCQSQALIDIGAGTSSFTSGRPAPVLALGYHAVSWGLLYRSVGVQTTIYAQNSWTSTAYKDIHVEKLGVLNANIGAGLGASYMLRSYRQSLTSQVETVSETVVGPHLLLKLQLGMAYLGFDTLLGLNSNLLQHLVLNFQDVSYITIGFSL